MELKLAGGRLRFHLLMLPVCASGGDSVAESLQMTGAAVSEIPPPVSAEAAVLTDEKGNTHAGLLYSDLLTAVCRSNVGNVKEVTYLTFTDHIFVKTADSSRKIELTDLLGKGHLGEDFLCALHIGCRRKGSLLKLHSRTSLNL